MAFEPVTLTPQSAADLLERLLASPPLALSVEGGGLPDRQSFEPAEVLLIERWEVKGIAALLRRWPEVADAPVVVNDP